MSNPVPQLVENQVPLGGQQAAPRKNIIDQLFDGLFGN